MPHNGGVLLSLVKFQYKIRINIVCHDIFVGWVISPDGEILVEEAHDPVGVAEGDVELEVVMEEMCLVCFREVELVNPRVVYLDLHLLRVDDDEEEADGDANEDDDGDDDPEKPA